MPRAATACLLSIPALLMPAVLLGQADDRVEEVEAAVATFASAFAEADVERLESLLTEDYSHVNGSSGTVSSRGEWLRWMRSRRQEIDRGELVVSDYRIRDLAVHVYGGAAVVTAVAHSRGKRGGEPFTSTVRFTNLWVLEADRWRRAAFHDSPLP